MTFILGQFHKRCPNHQFLKSVWKLHILNSNFWGANELIHLGHDKMAVIMQMSHFLERRDTYFESYFAEDCSEESKWQFVSISPSHGLALNKWKSMLRINVDPIPSHIELNRFMIFYDLNDEDMSIYHLVLATAKLMLMRELIREFGYGLESRGPIQYKNGLLVKTFLI